MLCYDKIDHIKRRLLYLKWFVFAKKMEKFGNMILLNSWAVECRMDITFLEINKNMFWMEFCDAQDVALHVSFSWNSEKKIIFPLQTFFSNYFSLIWIEEGGVMSTLTLPLVLSWCVNYVCLSPKQTFLEFWAQFHQCSTYSFCARRFRKRKNSGKLSVSFYAFGIYER